MKERTLFEDYGIEILKRNDKFFIRYDAGGIAVQFREAEITEKEANKASESDKDAYEVLLEIEKGINNKFN